LPKKLLVFVGSDMPTEGTYSGKIAHVRVVLGKGAYVKPGNKDFEKDGDPFAFDFG
jgi:hypothetical protein